MKTIFFFLSLFLTMAAGEAWAKCKSTPCAGCKRDRIDANKEWKNFVDTVKKETGAYPISCLRTHECQKILAESCERGRAAKPGSSLHEHGIAMDYHTSQGKKALEYRSLIKGGFASLLHSGGGYHFSNGQGKDGRVYQRRSPSVQRYRAAKASGVSRRSAISPAFLNELRYGQ